jgi:hypothetical protein
MNLRLNNSGNNPRLENFKVSVQDSNINITSCQRTNSNNTGLRLRYVAVGRGEQTFNFGLDLRNGSWIIVCNGIYLIENKGWRSLSDGTLIIIGATGNVSITYSVFNFGFGVPDTSNQPFQQQHSVAIATAFSFAVVSVIVLIIRIKNHSNKTENPINTPIQKSLRNKPKISTKQLDKTG